MQRTALALVPFVLAATAAVVPAQSVRSTATAPFPNFESGPVRPLLLSADGAELYVLNVPDHRVEVYATGTAEAPALAYQGSVFTGLEPVSMVLHPSDPEVLFVANHLSDTVSVVDLPRRLVVATIPVGDEPAGMLVANGELYVATSRSSTSPGPVQPGAFVENAVVVAQVDPPYAIQARVEIPGHRPRALAVLDGNVVALPLNSGNHTTVISEIDAAAVGLADQRTLDAFDTPFETNPALGAGLLSSNQFLSPFGENGWEIPRSGRIVNDNEYPNRTHQLPDSDVVAIDTSTYQLVPPHVTGVGTTLFDAAVSPATGELWVVNTEAKNRQRFEPQIQGDAFENQITIVAGGAVQATLQLRPPFTSAEHAQPAAIAFYRGTHGDYAYVGSLGTATIVVLDPVQRTVVAELPTGFLPSGFAVDSQRAVLWVACRGENAVRAYDIAAGHTPIQLGAGTSSPLAYDPEPKTVRAGRKQLYDARSSSGAGTGNFSCASCHVFGHLDTLAWDLGNPAGGLGYFFPDLLTGELSFDNALPVGKRTMMTHPMKGPMVTQSFRSIGESRMRPLHWRGDRRFFQVFRGAFEGLLGGSGISERSMQEYATFISSLRFGPNPYQPKDRVYVGAEATGKDLFGATPGVPGKEYNSQIPGNVTCVSCHKGNFVAGDFTGSQETVNFDGEQQMFNTAGLRGLYEKEFMDLTGFGLLHDGSIEDIIGFLSVTVGGVQGFPNLTPQEKSQVAAFVKAWDSGTPPTVGAQHTGTPGSIDAWLDLAEAQARPPVADVDLIAKGRVPEPGGGETAFGLWWSPDTGGAWSYLSSGGRRVGSAELRQLVANGAIEVTFTVVPAGTGRRLGIDRDEDGVFDAVERWLGTDPAAPDSDGDGYDDGLERRLASDPTTFDAHVPEDVAPTVEAHAARMVFATTATLHAQVDEPAAVLVELGTTAGTYDLASFADADLARVHDVVLDALPAGTTLHYRVTATDKNGNAGTAAGSFTTTPPMLNVDDVTLTKTGTGPWSLTATVRVVDSSGNPIDDISVRGVWQGNGVTGQNWFPLQRTDATGTATFTIPNVTQIAQPSTSFMPAYVGSPTPSDAWYVGLGGDWPTFFYNQSANRKNYGTVSYP